MKTHQVNLLVWKEKQMESRRTRLIPLLIPFDMFSFLSEARLYLCHKGNRKENTSILFDTVMYLWVHVCTGLRTIRDTHDRVMGFLGIGGSFTS